MTALFGIAKTGLMAAQTGLTTTGHNIANASTPGYSRQVVVQGTPAPLNVGVGFIGTGTEVAQVKRIYDDFLNKQLLGVQAQQASVDTYLNQISQIDNMLSDATVGLSPALQGFFKGIQDANSAPASSASRQAMLSAAETMTGRFHSMNDRLSDLQSGTNNAIAANVSELNAFARKVADLNNQIAGLSIDPSRIPNDLLDQRDQIISEMNKIIKVNVQQTDNHMLNVSFGTGQPLVLGGTSQALAVGTSDTDPSRVVVGYQTQNRLAVLPDSVLIGGSLGGLVQFRNEGLDKAQNQLGLIAAGLADTFNDQHQLGLDQNGQPGGKFFNDIQAFVGYDRDNADISTLDVQATIVDGTALTGDDYDMTFNGTDLVVTRRSDNQQTIINPFPQGGVPQVIDGVSFNITGAPSDGDHVEIRPTYTAASRLQVAIADGAKIALAAPISTAVPSSNTGNVKMSPGQVDAAYLLPGNALAAPVNLTYDLASNTLNGFPAVDVTVTDEAGVATVFPAGTPVTFTSGAKISFGGINVTLTGTPGDTDQFNINPGSGVGDNRNGVLLAGLQTRNMMLGGSATYQSTYAGLVNMIGNRTREADIGSAASETAVAQATAVQQSVSGVNLDEEAANLIRYQQAYQASAKVMATAATLFDTLLSLGG
ncbi:flagellar hook-associated protein FlgK [Pseudoduganella sp. OTU4001]|uniref:flagellar hook-associated protein FlgK n=1 Tax=Pseudoduganella sp. OTU4001 TaxID=3043854 RepID=UPI00313F3224